MLWKSAAFTLEFPLFDFVSHRVITLLHFHLFVVRQRYLYKLWLKILNIVEIYRFC